MHAARMPGGSSGGSAAHDRRQARGRRGAEGGERSRRHGRPHHATGAMAAGPCRTTRATAASPARRRWRSPARCAARDFVRTKYSPDGTRTRGTLNNCAHGVTPWNTYLTGEENWAGYFRNGDQRRPPALPREQSRYGVPSTHRPLCAGSLPPAAPTSSCASTPRPPAPSDAGLSQRAEHLRLDRRDRSVQPRERRRSSAPHSAASPMKAWCSAPATEGRPVVAYSGDDCACSSTSTSSSPRARIRPPPANGSLLDEGTLYVAQVQRRRHR